MSALLGSGTGSIASSFAAMQHMQVCTLPVGRLGEAQKQCKGRNACRYYDRQQIAELKEGACYNMPASHILVRALERGIGVHHAGLPTKYRQNVEILFRCRYLQCVIATGVCATTKFKVFPCPFWLSRMQAAGTRCTSCAALPQLTLNKA